MSSLVFGAAGKDSPGSESDGADSRSDTGSVEIQPKKVISVFGKYSYHHSVIIRSEGKCHVSVSTCIGTGMHIKTVLSTENQNKMTKGSYPRSMHTYHFQISPSVSLGQMCVL